MQVWTHFLWLLLVNKIVYIWSYHRRKTVSHWIINIFGLFSLEVLSWSCPSLKFRKRQIFCKREPQQALQSLFCFFTFHPLFLSCSTGRGLRLIPQENRYGIEIILFALSCGPLREVVYLHGVSRSCGLRKRLTVQSITSGVQACSTSSRVFLGFREKENHPEKLLSRLLFLTVNYKLSSLQNPVL